MGHSEEKDRFMRLRSKARWPLVVAAFLVGALGLAAVRGVQADARSDYLVRLLQGSSQFRVRAHTVSGAGTAWRAGEFSREALVQAARRVPAPLCGVGARLQLPRTGAAAPPQLGCGTPGAAGECAMTQ